MFQATISASFWRNRAIDRHFRVNEQIRISPLRVVDSNGVMRGVIPREQALALARETGLDLVEVAPSERPPVCRIMDYGKFKYEQKKKTQKQKAHHQHVKEIRLRPKIDDNDVQVKINHARALLAHKDKIMVAMLFRGREITHVEQGRAIMESFLGQLQDVAKVEKPLSMEGRRLAAVLAPKSYPDKTEAR